MSFAGKARKAIRKALARKDCHHASYWLKQIELRDPKESKKRVTTKLRTKIKRCRVGSRP